MKLRLLRNYDDHEDHAFDEFMPVTKIRRNHEITKCICKYRCMAASKKTLVVAKQIYQHNVYASDYV